MVRNGGRGLEITRSDTHQGKISAPGRRRPTLGKAQTENPLTTQLKSVATGGAGSYWNVKRKAGNDVKQKKSR